MGYSEMQSIVDPSKMVYPDQWVLSLVVKPKGKNPEHAIIIVEGITEEEQFVYRRYDFVAQEDPNSLLKKGNGCVVIKNKLENTAEYSEDAREKYFWQTIMKDHHMIEGCEGISWIIRIEPPHKDQPKFLHDEVLKDRANPPDYQISGENALLPSSSSQSGHNCFTWATSKIKSIKDHAGIQQDQRLKSSILDFIAARTSRHLTPPDEDPTSPAPKCNIM